MTSLARSRDFDPPEHDDPGARAAAPSPPRPDPWHGIPAEARATIERDLSTRRHMDGEDYRDDRDAEIAAYRAQQAIKAAPPGLADTLHDLLRIATDLRALVPAGSEPVNVELGDHPDALNLVRSLPGAVPLVIWYPPREPFETPDAPPITRLEAAAIVNGVRFHAGCSRRATADETARAEKIDAVTHQGGKVLEGSFP